LITIEKNIAPSRYLTLANIPDGVYAGGMTGYAMYIKVTPGNVIEAKSDVGLRCPFPTPFDIEVVSGKAFALHQPQPSRKMLDKEMWDFHKEKFKQS
jgi:hypothetical protein